MIKLNKLSESVIQIMGSYECILATGIAYKRAVPGNRNTVWQYNLTLLSGGFKMTIVTNEKEGTITREDLLKKRIERNCVEFQQRIEEKRALLECDITIKIVPGSEKDLDKILQAISMIPGVQQVSSKKASKEERHEA